MRKFLYLFLFLVLFIWFFINTFPVDTIFGHFLNKYNIKYGKIAGNLLKVKITDIQYQNIRVPQVYIIPHFLKLRLKIQVDKSAVIFLNFNKTASVYLENLTLEKYQINPQIYGKVGGKTEIFLRKNYIQLDGNLSINIREIKTYGIKNLKIVSKLSKENRDTSVDANISGSSINGRFRGKLIIPAKNIYNTKLKGQFEGTLYGSSIKQSISIEPLKYVR